MQWVQYYVLKDKRQRVQYYVLKTKGSEYSIMY